MDRPSSDEGSVMDYVRVLTSPDMESAFHAKSLIEAAGIEVEVFPESRIGVMPLRQLQAIAGPGSFLGDFSTGPFHVVVLETDAERARDLLRSHVAAPRPPAG
jgi:hypothetical protein